MHGDASIVSARGSDPFAARRFYYPREQEGVSEWTFLLYLLLSGCLLGSVKVNDHTATKRARVLLLLLVVAVTEKVMVAADVVVVVEVVMMVDVGMPV